MKAAITAQTYRFPNGRTITLRKLDGVGLCPVCGAAAGESFDLEPGDVLPDGTVQSPTEYAGGSYYICPACGVEYGCDCNLSQEDVVPEGGDTHEWRQQRRAFLRRFGRTAEVFEHLERIGAEPDHDAVEPPDETPPLIRAAAAGDVTAVRGAIAEGLPRDIADWDGWTALTWAAAMGHAAVAEELLNAGAAVDARNVRGETPLMWAAWRGQPAVARVLLRHGAAVHARTTGGPIHPTHSWVPTPPARPGPPGRTALLAAAGQGNDEVVATLLAANATVDAADELGRTALASAATPAVAQLLIAAGAAVDHRDTQGWTPLMGATHDGRVDVMEALVRAGADVNAISPGRDGDSPLLIAAGRNNHAAARLLLRLGADPCLGNAGGIAPLHEAASQADAEMVQLLIDAGADVNGRGYREGTPLRSALHRFGPKIENARVLLAAGADVNLANVRGETQLMTAVSHGRPELVRLVIEAGADLNAREKRGQTALHSAVLHGSTVMVTLLLEAGADPSPADRRGKTPLDYAVERRQAAIEKLLREALEGRAG